MPPEVSQTRSAKAEKRLFEAGNGGSGQACSPSVHCLGSPCSTPFGDASPRLIPAFASPWAALRSARSAGSLSSRAQTFQRSLVNQLPFVRTKENDLIVERFDKSWVLNRVNKFGQVLPSTWKFFAMQSTFLCGLHDLSESFMRAGAGFPPRSWGLLSTPHDHGPSEASSCSAQLHTGYTPLQKV